MQIKTFSQTVIRAGILQDSRCPFSSNSFFFHHHDIGSYKLNYLQCRLKKD